MTWWINWHIKNIYTFFIFLVIFLLHELLALQHVAKEIRKRIRYNSVHSYSDKNPTIQQRNLTYFWYFVTPHPPIAAKSYIAKRLMEDKKKKHKTSDPENTCQCVCTICHADSDMPSWRWAAVDPSAKHAPDQLFDLWWIWKAVQQKISEKQLDIFSNPSSVFLFLYFYKYWSSIHMY